MDKQKEIGLKVFNEICDKWQVSGKEKTKLLKDQNDLERISNIMTIYRHLHTIFPTAERADAWPRKPNKFFGGKSALEVMQDDPVPVRKYLEAQL